MDRGLSERPTPAEVLELLGVAGGAGGVLELEELRGSEVPAPYRALLVHERDMTGTLEAFCGQRVRLRPLAVERAGSVLRRRVLLVSEGDGRTVELGAIRIHLDCFDAASRRAVLEGVVPLGAILGAHGVAYTCHPRLYFRLRGASALDPSLASVGDAPLYGRVNAIRDGSGRPLADVVEVLPVLDGSGPPG